ncbi:MAG: hypothetical protein WAM60_00370 [Candidatus Promineifilaceae bacterium]
MSFDDPFANIEPQKPKKSQPRSKKKDQFDRPLAVSRREAYKATGTGGSAMHGEYYQLTTRLPLELVDQIREWASGLNMTQQDLQRYCFYRGLQALDEGERPEFEEVVVRKKLKAPE